MSAPVPIFGTQNVRDDDAAVIDSYDVETDAPPKPILEPIPIPAQLDIPRPTRILAGNIILTSGSLPQQILPADNDRVVLRIYPFWVNGTPNPGFNDYVSIGEDIGSVSNAQTNLLTWGTLRLRPIAALGASAYEFNEHTGPIWVAPGNALTAPIELSWMAITK